MTGKALLLAESCQNARAKNREAFQVDTTRVGTSGCRDNNTVHQAAFSFANHCGKHFLISEPVYKSISAVRIMILGGWFWRKFIIKFPPALKLMTDIEVSVNISHVLGYILPCTISIFIFPDTKLRKKTHKMIACVNWVKSLSKHSLIFQALKMAEWRLLLLFH